MSTTNRDWTRVHNAIKAAFEHNSTYESMFSRAMDLKSDVEATEMMLRWDDQLRFLRREVTKEYLIAFPTSFGIDPREADLFERAVEISNYMEVCHG